MSRLGLDSRLCTNDNHNTGITLALHFPRNVGYNFQIGANDDDSRTLSAAISGSLFRTTSAETSLYRLVGRPLTIMYPPYATNRFRRNSAAWHEAIAGALQKWLIATGRITTDATTTFLARNITYRDALTGERIGGFNTTSDDTWLPDGAYRYDEAHRYDINYTCARTDCPNRQGWCAP